MSGFRIYQTGHVRVLQFKAAKSFTSEEISIENNKRLKDFLNGERPYGNKYPRRISYILQGSNIYLGSKHIEIMQQYGAFDIESLVKRIEHDEKPPVVFGWLLVDDLPRGKRADEKALGLTKTRRKILYIDGFSDFFRSLDALRIPNGYYEKQMEALSFFPSFLRFGLFTNPPILLEQLSEKQVLRVSHVNRHNSWEVIRTGYLLTV